MRFPCEIITEPYLAQLRISAAKYLHTHGYSQQSIANLLQVSQPIVSSYLSRKTKINPQIPEIITREAEKIGTEVGKLLRIHGLDAIPKAIGISCQSCKKLRQGGGTCYYHKMLNPYLEDNCTRCQTSETLIELQVNRENILNQLQLIYDKLIKTSKYNYLIPEIGLQIVIGTSDMAISDDIAGFPGRIIKRKEGLPVADFPIFGASTTMSKLLLLTKKYYPKVSGLAGIKTTEWLIEKLKVIKLPYVEFRGFDADYEKHIVELSKKQLLIDEETPFLVVDYGSIGYEAISYIFARNPPELISVFEQLLL